MVVWGLGFRVFLDPPRGLGMSLEDASLLRAILLCQKWVLGRWDRPVSQPLFGSGFAFGSTGHPTPLIAVRMQDEEEEEEEVQEIPNPPQLPAVAEAHCLGRARGT